MRARPRVNLPLNARETAAWSTPNRALRVAWETRLAPIAALNRRAKAIRSSADILATFAYSHKTGILGKGANRDCVRVVDLFCGAGMLSAGFSRVGFRPIFAIDVDSNAVTSFNLNVAPVAVCDDVSAARQIRCDVLLAGPPCQGFSTLGRRDGRDQRNDLSLCIVEWTVATGARVVVIENVPPFLESPQWRRVRHDLEGQGFETTVWTIDAYAVGAPQHRTRSFTIASKLGMPPEPRHAARKRQLADAIHSISANDPMHVWPRHSELTKCRLRRIPAGGDKRDLMRKAPELCPPSWFRLGPQATDVWGRMRWDRPANTLRCEFQNPSKGRYIHPTKNRVISLREGARLQGVPDKWLFSGGPGAIARQIGNGVPLQLGTAVARRIAELF